MKNLIITLDIDWACEAAIEETLCFFQDRKYPVTIFITHHSKIIEEHINHLDVGLHPFFGENSSHGHSISEVIKYITGLPHNLNAFRCHRFGICNTSKQALLEAGMQISSNVCTNLEIIPPFQDRFGLLEVPIFLEDGGYLWQNYPLEIDLFLAYAQQNSTPKVIVIHPMHFVINTPHFNYMRDIKQSLARTAWNNLSSEQLSKLRWKGRGIRDFIIDFLDATHSTMSLRNLYHDALKQRNLPQLSPELQN